MVTGISAASSGGVLVYSKVEFSFILHVRCTDEGDIRRGKVLAILNSPVQGCNGGLGPLHAIFYEIWEYKRPAAAYRYSIIFMKY